MTPYDVAVIGMGGAGQMAILRAALNHLNAVVFTGDPSTTKKSRATWVANVENIPGFFEVQRPITATSRAVLQFIAGREDLHAHVTVIKHAATQIAKDDTGFTLTAGGATYHAAHVVLCTGTMDVQPLISGSIEPALPFANREDLLYCIRCDGHRTVGHVTAVIGNQPSAGWIAVMLAERYQLPKIMVLSHGKPYAMTDALQPLFAKYQIDIIAEEITELLGDAKTTGLTGFRVGGRTVQATKAFVALGTIVYNELAQQVGAALNERDHVVVDAHGQTTVDGFYAAGDLVAGKKKQVYTAWDMAVDAVDHIDARVRVARR
jgi:thioredoxin reductase (NADPH)